MPPTLPAKILFWPGWPLTHSATWMGPGSSYRTRARYAALTHGAVPKNCASCFFSSRSGGPSCSPRKDTFCTFIRVGLLFIYIEPRSVGILRLRGGFPLGKAAAPLRMTKRERVMLAALLTAPTPATSTHNPHPQSQFPATIPAGFRHLTTCSTDPPSRP
jgi:hypothetical protein